MSALDPYKDFVTLTGDISQRLHQLANIMEQHSAAHGGKHRFYAQRLAWIAAQWEQLPYPHETSDKNGAYT